MASLTGHRKENAFPKPGELQGVLGQTFGNKRMDDTKTVGCKHK